MKKVRIWDLPTRLFHWTLVGLVALSVTTGLVGDIEQMEIHMLSGYGILTLILFRLGWGLIGSTYSRFTGFVRGPVPVIRYLQTFLRKDADVHPGHNPAAGWMVLALLAILLIQGTTGLFASDDIFVEGPLAYLVSGDTVNTLTSVHHLNFKLIVALIALHVMAVLFYQFYKKVNLTLPMITGLKSLPEDQGAESKTRTNSLWALPLLLLSVLVVYAVVNWI